MKISLIHSLQWINGYLATKINLRQEIPHIHSIISSSFDRNAKGFSLRSQFQRQCEDITFAAADILISITEAERQQLVEYYHVSPSKILIMGRTADFYYSYFYDIRQAQITPNDRLEYNIILKNNSITEKQKVFVYVGRIVEYKGIQEIIEAWYMLYTKYKEEMPPLWIIGGTETVIYQFRNLIIRKIPFLSECEKKHKIYWWGYIEHYGISTIFQKAHALLMHSAFEPGGRVILEAMAAGRPVIATPEGFSQTYIHDWYNGFQVKYQDIKRLSFYMDLFIKNEYLSSALGINAKNTYAMLTNSWKYYEKLDALYHSNEVILTEKLSFETALEDIHPFLIDEFPYCDIKNNNSDLSSLMNFTDITINEITKYKSYIWKISIKKQVFFAKQAYNQINLNQLWNSFDLQKVYTIWMQYNTTIISSNYPFIISPYKVSEKLFTYVLPIYEILPDDQIYKIYFVLLSKLATCEHGYCKADLLYNEQIQYFEKLNHTIQRKHKFYTMNTYAFEIQQAFEKNKILFDSKEATVLLLCFQKINYFLSLRKHIEYGLNYGKSFLMHVICKNDSYLLLPCSDIFIGELGQDEGIIFMSYFFKYHTFLEKSYYSQKTILIWSLLYCMELFISSKVLYKSCTIDLSDLKKIYEKISSEK